MFLELVSLVFILFLVYMYMTKAPPNYPPGPTPLPFIGNSHQLPSGNVFPTARRWSELYGPVIGAWLGRTPLILIEGVDCILEALRKEEFQSRPPNPAIKAGSFGKQLGTFHSNGEQWSFTRKFVMRNLKAYGKNDKENVISDEISRLMESFEDGNSKIVQGTCIFSVPALNVIWLVAANKRIDFGDERSRQFLELVYAMLRQGDPVGNSLVAISPVFRFVDPKFKGFMNGAKKLHTYFREIIQEHKEVLDRNNPMDLIDHYLIDMENNKTNEILTEENLIIIIFDLFLAGGDTASSSVDFILLYMVLYPQVQEKMQKEIDRVLGRRRKPNLDDKNEMHYTMAVITEVERLNSVAPTNVPHQCTRDTTFNGYLIPKGSIISMNLRSLGYDPKYWKNADEFYPERFLNDKGEFSKPAYLATFGLGQRQCVGEMFAKSIIFLFTTTFLEKFSVSLPPGEPEPSTVPLPGITAAPRPFNIQVTSRY